MKKNVVCVFQRFALIGITILALGCDRPSDKTSVDSEQSELPELVLAVLPYDVPTKLEQHFEPLLSYLSSALGQPVTIYVATSYEEQIQKIAQNQVDLAYLGPSSFVRAYDRFETDASLKIQPIATEVPYEGAIVVHKDSNINDVSSLKNHRFAFGAYQSYAGHFKIREVMREQGVRLSDLQLYRFMGRHERAVMSVVYGDFDAAAASAGIARRVESLNYPIKTLYVTEKLPPIVIAAAPDMPLEKVNQLKNVLLKPSFEGQEAITLFAPGGTFLPFVNRKYDSVRKVLATFEQ